MTTTKALDQGLLSLLERGQWQDRRHLKTAVSMIVGFILSSSSSVPKWSPYALGRALQAPRVPRRLARWLCNDRLQGHDWEGPLIQEALGAWGDARLYRALDTTRRWGQYGLSRLSVSSRGRAVPLSGDGLEHASAQVAVRADRQGLPRAAK